MKANDRIEIEKLGGLAGIGLPGSRIRCRATLQGAELSPAERACIVGLFAAPAGATRAASRGADRFLFRITLRDEAGQRQVEVDESRLVESLQDRLQDELI